MENDTFMEILDLCWSLDIDEIEELQSQLDGVIEQKREEEEETIQKELDNYYTSINDATDKEDIKGIVEDVFSDNIISEIDFNEFIYNCIIPKLEELGVNMEYNEETKETNYERVVRGNY